MLFNICDTLAILPRKNRKLLKKGKGEGWYGIHDHEQAPGRCSKVLVFPYKAVFLDIFFFFFANRESWKMLPRKPCLSEKKKT